MNIDNLESLLLDIRKKGADAADIVLSENIEISVSRRMGKLENVERSESKGLGIRVFRGRKVAIASTLDLSDKSIEKTADLALQMAAVVPDDEYSGLPDASQMAHEFPNLDLYDAYEPKAEDLSRMAGEAEEAALSHPGITNSEGGHAGYNLSRMHVLNSHGFKGSFQASSYSVSATVIAEIDGLKERDYDYSAVRCFSNLKNPAATGHSAAQRTLRRMGSRKIATCSAPVVFDPREAKGILRQLAGAINGAAVARGASFLKDKLNTKIFRDGISIIDDPFIVRGLASRPFDAEGLAGQRLSVVSDGYLTSWILDTRTAKQLKMRSTGHAGRGISSPPHPETSNFYLENGTVTPEDLISDIKHGLYITETFGMGINLVTGDYSQGAAGFLIENGKLTYPVSEVTIAGHLLDMFKHLTPANNLKLEYSTNSPTLRMDKMMIAGS